MSFEQIEDTALQLSEGDRAKLAQKLLLSLDVLSESEIADDWLLEAPREGIGRGHCPTCFCRRGET